MAGSAPLGSRVSGACVRRGGSASRLHGGTDRAIGACVRRGGSATGLRGRGKRI